VECIAKADDRDEMSTTAIQANRSARFTLTPEVEWTARGLRGGGIDERHIKVAGVCLCLCFPIKGRSCTGTVRRGGRTMTLLGCGCAGYRSEVVE